MKLKDNKINITISALGFFICAGLNFIPFSNTAVADTGIKYSSYDSCIAANQGKNATDPTYNGESYCEQFSQGGQSSNTNSGGSGVKYNSYSDCIAANQGKSATDPTYNGETYCEQFSQTGSSGTSGGASGGTLGGSTSSGGPCEAPLKLQNGLCLPANGFNSGLAGSNNLASVIVTVVDLLLGFAGVVAVVMLIVGGFWYMTSAGSEELAEKGRKALLNAIIGIIVVLLAFAIVKIINNTLTANTTSVFENTNKQ